MQKKYILASLVALSFILIVGIVMRYTGAADIPTQVTIGNIAPTVDTIRIATSEYGADTLTLSGILPAVGADRIIHVNGQITDSNGENGIASSTLSLVFRRTSLTNTCTADNNNCYRITTCATNYADGTDTQISYSCPVPLAYWADATDATSENASDTWTAVVSVSDNGAATGTLSVTTEVNSLLALDLPASINYGIRELGEQSSSTTNVPVTITQNGNTKADLQVQGGRMNCSIAGSLATSSQAWALTDVGYSSAIPLTGTSVATNRNIGFRTNETTALSDILYWNIAIPSIGVEGTCTGSNTLAVIAQTAVVAAIYTGPTANHSFAIKTDGTLWAWGNNANGQLGLGDTTNRLSPVKVGTEANWASVGVGAYHTIAIKTDGTLWAWGYNNFGALGLGDLVQRTSPTQVGTLTTWSQVAAGGYHTVAIKTDGTLHAWGRNIEGQLGLGDNTDRYSPVQVGAANDRSKISAGSQHVLALSSNGTLYGWGRNSEGELGLGDAINRNLPTNISSLVSVMSTGDAFSQFIKTDGTLWASGHNVNGQLGIGNFVTDVFTKTQVGTATNWSKVSAAGTHTHAIKTDGTLWAWGQNSNGQLGLGDTLTTYSSPTQVGTLTTWSQLTSGSNHTLAIKTDGTLWAWGLGSSGQLGLGDTTGRTTPTQIPSTSFAMLPLRERRNRVV